VVAGNKLATRYDKLKPLLKEAKTKLAPKVDSDVLAILGKTKTVELLTTTDATMTEVDRGTDRCIAAFQAELDAIERVFDHGVIIPLTDDQSARLDDALMVRGTLLPLGTGFLKLVYSQQWVHMNNMAKGLGDKEVDAAIKRLGLGAEKARLLSWVALYGAKLGVTDTNDADPAAVSIEAWHEAYGELLVDIHSEYKDTTDETQVKIRTALLGPYYDQIEEERRVDQKTRAKRQPAEPPAPADAKKP
jgi:hypothetical protein